MNNNSCDIKAKDSGLLIIDMINDFDFIDGEILLKKSIPVAKNILKVKNLVKEKSIPVIYVNDNFGKWKSDFRLLIEHCINDNTLGKDIVSMLIPDKEDYFVLKPKHSAFYSTTLEVLLEWLKVNTLIITGVKTESCVLATALDAYMRDYKIVVLEDCIASLNNDSEVIIDLMKKDFKAAIADLESISFNE